jgi:hypothetical protein
MDGKAGHLALIDEPRNRRRKIVELLRILFAMSRAGFPLPKFTDLIEVKEWLTAIRDPEAELFVYLASQIKSNQRIALAIPGGEEIVLYEAGVYCSLDKEVLGAKLDAVDVSEFEKLFDGSFLEWLKNNLPTLIEMLPYIIQVITLFLDKNPEPTPNVDPVV